LRQGPRFGSSYRWDEREEIPSLRDPVTLRLLMRTAQLVVAVVLAFLVAPLAAAGAEPKVAAASWYLVGHDGSVLARNDAARARAIASITKLMTAVVVLERADLADTVRVTPRAATPGESSAALRAGERLTVAELVRAMLVPSGNDAADALALHVGRGSADVFVELMNAKAAELGLTDTHFENPHGLDQPGHVSSARDATALVRHALGIPFLRDAMSRETATLPGGRTLTTTDDALELGAARGWQDRAHGRRRLVAGGGGRAGRRHGLRDGARERDAHRAQRCAP
jgi:D-alanyl-D-alanine carboxypeptidase